MNLTNIKQTENYGPERIAQIANNYTNFTKIALHGIVMDYENDIERLTLELESAKVRKAIAKAVLAAK